MASHADCTAAESHKTATHPLFLSLSSLQPRIASDRLLPTIRRILHTKSRNSTTEHGLDPASDASLGQIDVVVEGVVRLNRGSYREQQFPSVLTKVLSVDRQDCARFELVARCHRLYNLEISIAAAHLYLADHLANFKTTDGLHHGRSRRQAIQYESCYTVGA